MLPDRNDATAMPREARSRYGIYCPHCGSSSKVRSSRVVDQLVRSARVYCTNVENCGHVFGAQIAITHTIAASMIPNPDVWLPTVPPRVRARPVPANDVRMMSATIAVANENKPE